MIFKFRVEYDTDTGRYNVSHADEKTWLMHSGSNYLRIMKRGEQYQYGTIGCHPPYPDTEITETHNYLQFAIQKELPEVIPEQPYYGKFESEMVPPFVDPYETIKKLEARIKELENELN